MSQSPEQWIRQRSLELGFYACGISRAVFLEEEAPRLEQWLQHGMHGTMGYMERNFDKRLDPRKLVDGAKTVISLLFNYYSPVMQVNQEVPKISRYAYGEDYHVVLKEKLNQLLREFGEKFGEVSGRVFTDSAPVLERAWAVKSGLGWIGKNANLLNKGSGSYYFLCELIIDRELQADNRQATNHCGTCTACIDACPTQAIVAPSKVDSRKCISYLTIELRDELPSEAKGKMDNWIFGCDVCQEVCPWNRFAIPNGEPRFSPRPELTGMKAEDWAELSRETFDVLFKLSPIQRTGYNGLKHNVVFLRK